MKSGGFNLGRRHQRAREQRAQSIEIERLGENAAYQHGIQATAAANPTVTTSTNHYTNNVQDAQSNVVSGGYDQNAAYQQAASSASPDVAKNQAATVYYNALRTAIGAAV